MRLASGPRVLYTGRWSRTKLMLLNDKPLRTDAVRVAFVVCALAVACGSSSSSSSSGSTADAGPPSVTECSEHAKPASDKVRAVIESNRACTVDADCESIGISSACFDQCSTAIAKSGRAAVEKALDDVGANECKAFADAGCKVIIPPCEPPSPPACRDNKCS